MEEAIQPVSSTPSSELGYHRMYFEVQCRNEPLGRWRMIYRQLVGLAIVLFWVNSFWASPLWATPQAYWVGLDFIDSPVPSPQTFFKDFEPFPITATGNHFVTQGGLAGWNEDQARRAVALAVEDVFRALDVGDPWHTLRLGFYLGPVPGSLDGQRLNLVLGQPDGSGTALGETPRPGDYDDPLANDTVVAATYLNNIDNLAPTFVTYDTALSVINAIAGTTAHEIGHIFGATHVTTSAADPAPLPIMASEQDGLPTEARLTERRFSLDLPVELSNAELLIQNIGTVLLGDFNLDTEVDESDLSLLVDNWGLTNRLNIEGNANGDNWVDGADAGLLIANWTGNEPISYQSSAGELQWLLNAEESPLATNGGVTWSTAVPEPNGLLLAGCGWGTLLFLGRLLHINRLRGYRKAFTTGKLAIRSASKLNFIGIVGKFCCVSHH
jgi:hypothetical protein